MRKLIEFYRSLFARNSAWFRFAVGWFVGTALIGFFTFFKNQEILKVIVTSFQDRFGAAPALDFRLVLQIFLQNILASALGLFGGLVFGLGPLIVLSVNGFILGYVLASLFSASATTGIPIFLVLGGIVPHGIFELPSFLIASALGLRLGYEWLQKINVGQRVNVLKKNFIQSIFTLPGIAFILFIAALIEVYVSGRIVHNL